MEHYLELTATEDVVTYTVLFFILDLSVMEQLVIDPTTEELSKVIDCLASGKAPGSDGIPPELIKSGKLVLLMHLHELLSLLDGEKIVPQDIMQPCPRTGRKHHHLA